MVSVPSRSSVCVESVVLIGGMMSALAVDEVEGPLGACEDCAAAKVLGRPTGHFIG